MKRKKSFVILTLLCSLALTFMACYEMIEAIIGDVAVNAMKGVYIESRQILDDGQIHVVVSGSGSPRITDKRAHPCTAVIANGQFLIFDAGSGAVDKLSHQGYPIQDVEHVFLTHMHSDHMGGIANLVNLSYNIGRRNVVHVYGPDDSKNLTHSLYPPTSEEYRAGDDVTTPDGLQDERLINELTSDDLRNGVEWGTSVDPQYVYLPGVIDMVDGINKAYLTDTIIRTSSKQIPDVPQGWEYNRAEAHVIGDMPDTTGDDHGWGELLEVARFPDKGIDNGGGHGELVIYAFLVDHYPCWPSYGYRVEYAGKIVVISGDTESLVPYETPGEVSYWATYAQDADIFVHEAVSMQVANIMLEAIRKDPELMAVPGMDQRVAQLAGAADHHTDVLDVARAARDANAAKLVLTHIPVPTPVEFMEDLFVEGMDEIYTTGEIILGGDGMDIIIPLP